MLDLIRGAVLRSGSPASPRPSSRNESDQVHPQGFVYRDSGKDLEITQNAKNVPWKKFPLRVETKRGKETEYAPCNPHSWRIEKGFHHCEENRMAQT